MATNQNKTTIHLYIDKQIMKNFEAAFPRCRSRFLENALALATKDKIFFDKIFFKDMFND